MSSDFVQDQIARMPGVKSVASVDKGVYTVERSDHEPFLVRVVSIPRLGRSDALRLIAESPKVQVIVNPGARRHVLEEARAIGEEANVGIYVLRDLLGAVANCPTDALAAYQSSWRNWARTVLEGHPKVLNVYRECEDVLVAERGRLSTIRVVPREEYTLGVATVLKVLRDHPDIDAILLANQYHSVSTAAADEARDAGIAAYTLAQMTRALHRDGVDFLNAE